MRYEAYVPVLAVVVSAALYHFSQKSAAKGSGPWALLAGAYFVAFCVTLVAGKPWRDFGGWAEGLRGSIPLVVLLGVACVGIEAGYMLAYRVGWKASSLWLHTTLGASVAMLLLATLVFREPLTAKVLAGWAVAVTGIVIMKV
jgi:drug/metabolite transporter (DMT)-like permease